MVISFDTRIDLGEACPLKNALDSNMAESRARCAEGSPYVALGHYLVGQCKRSSLRCCDV